MPKASPTQKSSDQFAFSKAAVMGKPDRPAIELVARKEMQRTMRARAMEDKLIPAKTPEDVALLRNTHPGLQHYERVYFNQERHCYIVDISSADKDAQPAPIFVGNIGVHLCNAPLNLLGERTSCKTKDHKPDVGQAASVDAKIPTVFSKFKVHDMSDENLSLVREAFPGSTGCRVTPYGLMDILYDDQKSLDDDQKLADDAAYPGQIDGMCYSLQASSATCTILPL